MRTKGTYNITILVEFYLTATCTKRWLLLFDSLILHLSQNHAYWLTISLTSTSSSRSKLELQCFRVSLCESSDYGCLEANSSSRNDLEANPCILTVLKSLQLHHNSEIVARVEGDIFIL